MGVIDCDSLCLQAGLYDRQMKEICLAEEKDIKVKIPQLV